MELNHKPGGDVGEVHLFLYDEMRNVVASGRLMEGKAVILTHALGPSSPEKWFILIGAATKSTQDDYTLRIEHIPPPDNKPRVQILSPQVGDKCFGETVRVQVQARDDFGMANVTVNGYVAHPQGGHLYIAQVSGLQNGKNNLRAIATDTKGQTETHTIPIRVDLLFRYGLVVGVGEYEHLSGARLQYSISDAQKIARILRERYEFDIPEDMVLVREGATSYNLIWKIAQLCSQATRNDTVLIYFSGHGRPGATNYLVTHDARVDAQDELRPNTVIDANNLKSQLESFDAGKIILILDSCYSGGAMTWRPNPPKVDMTLPPRTVFIASSDGSQPSWESDELQSGIFTHFLCQVLDNRQLADENGNGKTTLQEIEHYLREQVPAQARREKMADQLPIVKTSNAQWLSMELFEQ